MYPAPLPSVYENSTTSLRTIVVEGSITTCSPLTYTRAARPSTSSRIGTTRSMNAALLVAVEVLEVVQGLG